ncbi:hypothetical protein DK26_00150 [Bosea sp. WAO]|uniref:DUF2235 domain-containing protein n=1 Tax=Bosea sp. WAO TaxID=406341 RepID=UPI00074A4029|nr:DUF2235 domain-containing protein [Bosea sp. WAO]KUL97425.1 hypothetical protein DK26_00150 [Bosea sp. WAO]
MTGKKIILFSDGTGNSAAALFKTNVFRLYQAVDLANPDQIAFYDDGVGTSTFRPLAMLGGAFGLGLKRNVIDLYLQLSRTYEEGDRIYLFGFSRGAFTARILAGLVLREGLVRKGSDAQMELDAYDAFRKYRTRFKPRSAFFSGILSTARAVRDLGLRGLDKLRGVERLPRLPPDDLRIAFMGVWDTVSAYGLPIDELTRAWDVFFPLSVPDRNLHEHVERACHALALDDERNTFHPVLWNEAVRLNQRDRKAAPPTHIDEERISQVWFAGMHSNVGGGYPLDGLAYVSLEWMMDQVRLNGPLGTGGLRFRRDEVDRVRQLADHDAPMADSRRGLGGSYRYQPRKLALLARDSFGARGARQIGRNFVKIDRIKIHESVLRRIGSCATGYAPIVLPDRYAVVGRDGSITELPAPGHKPIPLPYPMEDSAQAQWRAYDQEWVWNHVWRRRVFYFSSIIVLLAVAALPVIKPAAETCTGPACFLQPAIDGVASFLPGFMQFWLASWRTHPATFAVLLLIFGGLLFVGGVLQTRIGDAMRPRWRDLTKATLRPLRSGERDVKESPLYRLRMAKPYQAAMGILKRNITPTLAGLAALFLIVAMVSRIGVTMTSTLGGYCVPTDANLRPTDAVVRRVDFTSNSVCWASAIALEKGRRYAITLKIEHDWRDGEPPPPDAEADPFKADLLGFEAERFPWHLRPFVLFRRKLDQFWFMPIARIGAFGWDEYPLYPNDWSRPGPWRGEMTAEITAKRTGELFLFVNDAILPLGLYQLFYANNRGTAKVTVTPLK